MLVRLLGLRLILAATAAAAQPAPCTPPRPGAWVEMAAADAPRMGEVADVRTGFLGGSKWWLWDAFTPLFESRVFDARCNAWRRTTVAKSSRLPKQMDRSHGVLFGDQELAVYGPAWEEAQGGALAGAGLGVFVLDGARLEWTSVAPAKPLIGGDALVVQGEGVLVFWDDRAARGAIFTLATKRWEDFTARPPLVGRGYDCSWLQGGAWLVANPTGVFRFELGAKTWSPVLKPAKPMEMPDLGACRRSSSAGGLSVAMPRDLSGQHRALFVLEGAGTSAWQLPWPEGSQEASVTAAGQALWLEEGSGKDRLRRYDRGAKRWVPVAIPKGFDAQLMFLSEAQGQAVLVQLLEASPPLPPGIQAPRTGPAPKPSPTRVSVWNGKRFGPPITLGTGETLRAEVQEALGGLAAIDGATIRLLDVSGRERLRLPAPPRWLAWSGFGPEAFVIWGVPETRVGNDCNNPFHPTEPDPRLPVCDPSREVTYTRISPGGFVLRRAGDDAPPK